jgi:Tfp pilus assembly protein PilF
MEAVTVYMRVGDYEAAIPHLQAATRLSPKLAFTWIALGDAATLSRKVGLAKSAYARAEALEPDNPLLIRGKGQLLISQEQLPAARKVLEAGLKRHPEDLELRHALGNLYLVMANGRAAVETLEPAVSKAPKSPQLHYLLAQAYERDMHLEKAIQEWETVVRIDPQFADAWGHLGLCQVTLTRYVEARPALERAIALDPSQSHYYSVLADSYSLDKSSPANFNQARELYRKSLQIDPKNDKALYAFAMMLTRRGAPEDLREAVGLFKQVLDLKPGDVNVLFKLAETHRRLGDKQEAEAYQKRFEEVSAIGRQRIRKKFQSYTFVDTPQAHVKLGRQHLEKGNYQLAETEFRLALDRDPTLSEARQGLERVRAARSSSSGASTP